MKITKSILKKIIKEEILRESKYMGYEERKPLNPRGFSNVGIDDDRLQQIRLFMSGTKIRPLKDLTDMEKNYIFSSLGDTPGIRKKLQDDRDKFPLGTGDAIIAAFEDFVAENGLNEDPQFKDGFEDHDYTTHYFDIHNQLVLGTIRRGGGDYLYNHIEEKGLLPELEEKMRDYVQKYTNPRKRPAKIQIIPYTNYQWNEDSYGEEL
jgi:hypothetical protein